MIRERASVLRYTYIAPLVTTNIATLTSSELIYYESGTHETFRF